jgi:penicillin amidase
VLPRLVRVLNIAIALIVVLLAAVVYWYAIRPLPKTSGEIAAPVRSAATIRRDARGIPHIEASSWQDALFLQGYVTAQDRLWQMDGLRRFSAGELSEVFGPASIARDQVARRMRMRSLAQVHASHLTPDQRAVFAEYARGVNHFISTHRGEYSLEFSLPGHEYDPRPWTIVDSIVVGLVMARDLSDSANLDFNRQELFSHSLNTAKMKTLFPAVEGDAVAPGSNAWAVSGSHTTSGKPILANDPHLSYGVPPTWYLVHMKAPGLNVSGASLPGVPCVLVGHNEQIAWGITALESDSLDLYREQLDPRTGRYLFNGRVEQAQLETEVIRVRGARPVAVQTWITRHGPVVATEQHVSYSLRWTANDGLTFPFWDIDRAQNWQQFQAAAQALWGPPLNFVYADRAGNIGYQAAGKVPIRHNFDGEIPVDGASGKFEWDGYIPATQMPSAFNPPSGILATANQSPFPPDFPVKVPGNYHSRYRINQIRARLSAKPKLDVADMLAIQKDVYSAYDQFLARQVIVASSHASGLDPLVREAVGVLKGWDGQMDKDHAAPLMTQLLSGALGLSLVRSDLNPSLPRAPLLPRPEIIQALLETRPSGWVPADNWDKWLLDNFLEALRDGRRRQGTPISKWRWGRSLQWNFQHPVGRQFPFVDRYFDIGPVDMSGSGTTVKQTTLTLGPSERMVVDFGDLDGSVQNLTTGESGAVASVHYKDQWPAYYVGSSFPMEFYNVDAKETLHIVPESGVK